MAVQTEDGAWVVATNSWSHDRLGVVDVGMMESPSSTQIPLIHSLPSQLRGAPPTITTHPSLPHCQARQTPHRSLKPQNPLPCVCIDNYENFHIDTLQITLVCFWPADFTFWPVNFYCVDTSSMMSSLSSRNPVAPAAYDLLLCHAHLTLFNHDAPRSILVYTPRFSHITNDFTHSFSQYSFCLVSQYAWLCSISRHV